MHWKKLLDTKDLIAYEKSTKAVKVRIEARFRNNRWRIYKTYNFRQGDEWISHVKEYIAASQEEANVLLGELREERELTLDDVNCTTPLKVELSRCYKEDFIEKWNFKVDDFNEDNFVIVRFDSQVKMDIVLHERYNLLERELLDKFIHSLGLKDISNKIQYDFFYFKRHSAKRRVYKKPIDQDLIAQFEFKVDSPGTHDRYQD